MLTPRTRTLLLLATLPTPLSAATWTSPTSGRWLDPTNWSTNSIPAAPEPATLSLPGTYTVTLDAATTTGPLTLDNPAATLLLDGSASPTLNLTAADTLLSAGTLTLHQLTTNTSPLLTISSNSGARLTNHAHINLTGTGGYSSPTLTRPALSANLTNTGTILAHDPAPGLPPAAFRIAGNVTNTGNITTGPRSSLQFGSTFHQNAGTLSGNITHSGNINFNHNGGSVDLVTFAPFPGTTATLNFGPGATSGTFALGSGSLTVPDLRPGNTLYVPPGTSANLSNNVNNGHLILNRPAPGATVNPASPAATLNAGSSAPFTNNGTLEIDNPNSPPVLLFDTFINNGTLNVGRADRTNDPFRSLANYFTNNGNIYVEPGASARVAGGLISFTQNAGTITTNDSFAVGGGTLNFNGGSTVGTIHAYDTALTISPTAGPAHFTFSRGTIRSDIPATTTVNLSPTESSAIGLRLNQIVTNAGTIRTDLAPGVTIRPVLAAGPDVTPGSLHTTGTLTNTGTITGYNPTPPNPATSGPTTPHGAILTVAGHLINQGSVVSRSILIRQTFTQNTGTLDVTGSFTLGTGATFNYNGGTLIGNPITLSSNATLNISPSAGPGHFTFTGTTGTLHAPSLAPGSTLTLSPQSGFSPNNPIVVTADPLTNHGTISLKPASVLKILGPLSTPGTIILDSDSTALLLDYTGTAPLDATRQQIRDERITLAPLSGSLYRVAYIDSALLSPALAQALSLNQPVDASTLIIKKTLQGDANLDGSVTLDDYALLDRSYALNLTNAHWSDGDFTYDGLVDQSDYLLIDRIHLIHQTSPAALLTLRQSQFGDAYVSALLTSIPEPTAPLLSALCFLLSTPLRRRRTTNR